MIIGPSSPHNKICDLSQICGCRRGFSVNVNVAPRRFLRLNYVVAKITFNECHLQTKLSQAKMLKTSLDERQEFLALIAARLKVAFTNTSAGSWHIKYFFFITFFHNILFFLHIFHSQSFESITSYFPNTTFQKTLRRDTRTPIVTRLLLILQNRCECSCGPICRSRNHSKFKVKLHLKTRENHGFWIMKQGFCGMKNRGCGVTKIFN